MANRYARRRKILWSLQKKFPQAGGRLRDDGRASKQASKPPLQAAKLPRSPSRTFPFPKLGRPRSSDFKLACKCPIGNGFSGTNSAFPSVRNQLYEYSTIMHGERGRKWDTERQQNSSSQSIVKHRCCYCYAASISTVYRTAAHCTQWCK